jgi:Ca-activated chloride channel family protein
MGSPAGSPIPVYNASGRQVDFKRDGSGSVVVTKLDELSLQKIADTGKGKYFRATNAQDELTEIYDDISLLERTEFGTTQFTDFEDRFQYFIAPAVVLLILELLISEKKILWLRRWNLLRREEVSA